MTDMMKQVSEVELAYKILQKTGHSMYFRELITEVLELKGRRIHSLAHAMSEVHTQINMDSRFVHMGKGMWGLVEWSPQQLSAHSVGDDADSVPSSFSSRREKLFEEIQQEYVASAAEPGERE
ncbi:DNA-directed RNA polymerase subunit delta [Pelosinus propionicus DSM 13327]|uniref:RNAP delta factor n=2 Tax=Pelosinus TaxID=365348 RepID=A0A1I4KE11_9FIRM|nr:DNA-directed RNA polymerase subunit delta [Pelosinus propionicus DSM 13327]